MKKLLPIIMLLVGSGAGVGAGMFLRPPAPPIEAAEVGPDEEGEVSEENHGDAKATTKEHDGENTSDGMEYVKLPNQFVVPLVDQDRISAMVVMALSVEVIAGYSDTVLEKEPKLRDEFLRVLFDHASIGGFDGAFITNENLDVLRGNLRDVAMVVMGAEVANDVLIFEIARQDY